MKYLIEAPHRRMVFANQEAVESFKKAIAEAPVREITDEEYWSFVEGVKE